METEEIWIKCIIIIMNTFTVRWKKTKKLRGVPVISLPVSKKS